MSRVYVKAWNRFNRKGEPILEIDREMTSEEWDALRGENGCGFLYQSVALLTPISVEAIDRMLDEQEAAERR